MVAKRSRLVSQFSGNILKIRHVLDAPGSVEILLIRIVVHTVVVADAGDAAVAVEAHRAVFAAMEEHVHLAVFFRKQGGGIGQVVNGVGRLREGLVHQGRDAADDGRKCLNRLLPVGIAAEDNGILRQTVQEWRETGQGLRLIGQIAGIFGTDSFQDN